LVLKPTSAIDFSKIAERVMSEAPGQAVRECASCRQPLTGRYCAHCGEEALDRDSLTVRHFIGHTLVDELAHLDSKLWWTMRCLLFRPGFLAQEYSAGRRRPYIHPAKLLITSIITYALLTQGGLLVTMRIGWLILSIAPTTVPENLSVAETVRRIDRFGILENLLAAKGKGADLSSEGVREKFQRRLNQFAQPLSFANVLLLALALYLFFHRRRRLLVEHGVFSMHLLSFVLLSSLALLPAVWLYETSEGASLAIMLGVTLWQFAYLAVSVRRFYFGGDRRSVPPWVYSVAAGVLIYILNSAFITGVQMLGGAIALRSI